MPAAGAQPARACHGAGPHGAGAHLSQLVRRAAAWGTAVGAARVATAGPVRAAGRRCPGRGPGLAAFLRRAVGQCRRQTGFHGQRGRTRPPPDPQGAGQRAAETGGVRAGRCCRSGGQLGGAVRGPVPELGWPGCARTGLAAARCPRALAGAREAARR